MSNDRRHAKSSPLRRLRALLAGRISLQLTADDLPARSPVDAAHWGDGVEPVVPMPRAVPRALSAATPAADATPHTSVGR